MVVSAFFVGVFFLCLVTTDSRTFLNALIPFFSFVPALKVCQLESRAAKLARDKSMLQGQVRRSGGKISWWWSCRNPTVRQGRGEQRGRSRPGPKLLSAAIFGACGRHRPSLRRRTHPHETTPSKPCWRGRSSFQLNSTHSKSSLERFYSVPYARTNHLQPPSPPPHASRCCIA